MKGIVVERGAGIARISLARPEAGNAIDLALAEALAEAAIACDEDGTVRCVLLRAEGRLFCAGGDITQFSEAGDDAPAYLKRITGALHVAIARLARMRKPLITAIQGPAAGAGMSLALLGDIALASKSAHFTPAYGAIGLTPDGGMSWLLPRLVGLRKAQELLLTNRRIAAADAAMLGLITRVVDDQLFESEVEALLVRLVEGPSGAMGAMRELLLTSFSSGLETQMELEARSIADAIRSREGREGVAAFLQKRKALFAERG
nr:enoyl-CoA hydratase-related protein [Sphingomonas sp. CDS-1]